MIYYHPRDKLVRPVRLDFFCDDSMSEVYEFFNSIVLLSPGLLISILVIFLTVNYIITIGSLFLVLVRLNLLIRHRISPSDHVRIQFESPWMRRDLIVALYFFFFTVVALLLTPRYLLAVIRWERIIIGQNCDS